MGLFKKKDKTPTIYFLLNDSVVRMKKRKEQSFYYALFDNEIEIVKKWCNNGCNKCKRGKNDKYLNRCYFKRTTSIRLCCSIGTRCELVFFMMSL